MANINSIGDDLFVHYFRMTYGNMKYIKSFSKCAQIIIPVLMMI